MASNHHHNNQPNQTKEAINTMSQSAATPTIPFQDDSTDCAICLEPLENEKVLTLSCGHKWHYDCLVQQLQTAQSMTMDSQRRLLFTGCQCAKCGQICEHVQLEHLTRATDVLRQKVDVLLEEQLRLDAPDVWKQAVMGEVEEGSSDKAHGGKDNDNSSKLAKKKQALMDEARRKYAFYLCSHCKEPYFGGTIECADEMNEVDDSDSKLPPEQRLCVACSPQSQIICRNPLEHGRYLVWKCRYCCKPSTHVCYGNVHFCDDCHDRNSQRHREIQQQQQQHRRGTSRETKPPPLDPIPCPGESCSYPKPNNQQYHCNGSSPTDCEQVYSCVVCDSSAAGQGYHAMAPGSHNLIVNPSGQERLRGWHQLNPRMSWAVEESELPVNADTTTNFVSSFQNCIMVQRVNLSEILRESVAAPIRFEISARYMGRTDCPSVFRMQAAIGWSISANNLSLDPRQLVQREVTDTLEPPPDYWERASLELQLDPSRVRTGTNGRRQLGLYVIVMGRDGRFWQGRFGSKVADVSVRALGSAEELEGILRPAVIEQGHQHGENRSISSRQQNNPQPRSRNSGVSGSVRGQGGTDATDNGTTRRMFWDLLIPVLCFLLFAWLTIDNDNGQSRIGYNH